MRVSTKGEHCPRPAPCLARCSHHVAGYPSWKISVGVSSPFPERVLAGLSAENASFFPSRRQVSFFNPKKKKEKAPKKSTKSAVKRKGELAAKSGSLWLLPPAESPREPPARGRRGLGRARGAAALAARCQPRSPLLVLQCSRVLGPRADGRQCQQLTT